MYTAQTTCYSLVKIKSMQLILVETKVWYLVNQAIVYSLMASKRGWGHDMRAHSVSISVPGPVNFIFKHIISIYICYSAVQY